MIKEKTVKMIYCDFCGKEIGPYYQTFEKDEKCAVCGKHVCSEHNKTYDLSYRGYSVPICPDDIGDLRVKQYIELVKKIQMSRNDASI